MDYQALREEGKKALENAGIENAELDSFYLIEHLTGFSMAEFLLSKKEAVPEGTASRFKELVQRRAGHEPLQYIVGEAWFMGLPFKVSEDVLIPRQDTEVLAEKAIEIIEKLPEGSKVLDLCTGSGALAVAVKHYCPKADVTGSDVSASALDKARENARNDQAEVTFVLSDMFEDLHGQRFDVILSNPPYISAEEFKELMPEVKDHEPESALLSGEDGLDHYRIIAEEAGRHLTEKGILLLETGCSQAEAVRELFERDFENIEVIKDLSGLDRVVKMQLR